MVLNVRVNIDYFLKHNFPVDVYNGDEELYSLYSTNLVLKYYLEDLRLQMVKSVHCT
jgi:hypothetical protein